jgi:serine/threonine protein kinase
MNIDDIYTFFGLNPSDWHCVSFGTGLINATWVLRDAGGVTKYILQKINHRVFKRPEDIAYNLEVIGEHLARLHPEYLFIQPLRAPGGEVRPNGAPGGDSYYLSEEGDYYRLFPFVGGSKTLEVVTRPEQAYEAARSFARFSYLLRDLNPLDLRETLPHFHDLGLRYRQFEAAAETSGGWEVAFLKNHSYYVDTWNSLRSSGDFPLRVMHHDTKISNILFDPQDKALCVIDLDTVMPGYFISDVGDMMRTYLPPVSEEEEDLSRIRVRPEYFKAIVTGYLHGMEGSLTVLEQDQFLFAGRFMIYMQALRFMTDYLTGDRYYGARYPEHNLVRARNQIRLLESFNETLPALFADMRLLLEG